MRSPTFIDEQSAFLVQKGIYEYSRAAPATTPRCCSTSSEFHDALERSRWRAYPLGLAMVGEVVEGVLRPHAGGDAPQHADNLRAFVLVGLRPLSGAGLLGRAVWGEARAELNQRLQLLGLHPPKRVIDVPEPYAGSTGT